MEIVYKKNPLFVDGFLGIGEGRVKMAKAEADAVKAQAQQALILTQVEADLLKKNSGVLTDAQITENATNSKTLMYLIIAAALVLTIGVAAYFKFGKK